MDLVCFEKYPLHRLETHALGDLVSVFIQDALAVSNGCLTCFSGAIALIACI